MNKIEITPELLADLKAKAEEATPGPWDICAATAAKNSFKSILIHGNEQIAIVKTPRGLNRHGSTKDIRERDAAYIAAANPQVVLGLIARIEKLEANNYGPEILNDPQALTVSYFAGRMAERREKNMDYDALVTENMKLEKEVDWLASRVPRHKDICADCMIGPDCDTCRRKFWREAARKAVEETCKSD